MAPALARACLLGLGAGTAAALSGSLDGLLASHSSRQDASELVQVSVALHGRRESGAEAAAAAAGEQPWPVGQWQDDLLLGGQGQHLEDGDPAEEEDEGEVVKPITLHLSRDRGQNPMLDHRRQPTSRVLVYPEKRLAFCYIEKNAGTQFNKLFNRLNRIWYPGDMMPHTLSSALFRDWDYDELTHAAGWKWAVFLRDPLVRYLSAWSSKCADNEDKGSECLPQDSPRHNSSVEAFEANVLANYGRREDLRLNPHWAPQSDFCNGLKGARDYDFVRVLKGDVNAEVREMFRMVNATGRRVDKFVDYLFPPNIVRGHSSHLDPAEYYRQDDIRQKVEEMYSADYELPGLKKA